MVDLSCYFATIVPYDAEIKVEQAVVIKYVFLLFTLEALRMTM